MSALLLLAACGGNGEPPEAPAAPTTQEAAQKPAAGDHKMTLDFGGQKRTFLLHAPPGYTGDKPVPLVVAMHFFPGDGAALRDMIEMDAKADKHGFLVAYPDGVSAAFNALICCGAEDDVGFLKALTEKLVADWKVDPDRIYATGISNGADMSFRAAVEASGVFAAVGPVSGGLGGPLADKSDFVPKEPVSVLTIVGANDQYYDTFQAGLTKWRERLDCKPVETKGKGFTRSKAKCADGSDVEVYVVTDMGHSWPGAKKGPMAIPDAPIVATDLLWAFFAAHKKL
ncbi:alpha/beta hydrolase family esterase [Actinoplanes solisilvae]|uniref:alpha/beta hydrolase family esterase n=1 Tax=Actinoplanes solisilvae TaxID=2486853 RepID=UPI001F0C6D2D|nr:PHB depolymerase family esterase [Actinoplanes solisilvae]